MKLKLLLPVISLLFFTSIAFSQLKVSCIGASVAAGYGIPASQNYPSQMQDILGSTFNVGNFGVSGATLMKEANDPYTNSSNYTGAQGFNPNIVTIELGSNDSKPYNWAYQDSFVSDYTQFINVFRSLPNHPVIYICLPIPALTSNYDLNDSNITYGIIPLVKQIAADDNVKLIDLNTPLKGHPELYQADGIHPNDSGALILAQVISRAIAAPANLTANVISINEIDLSWMDNTNETSFTIERSADSITWATLATVAANTTSYSDVGLSASTKYYYRMYATISVGNTAYSDVVSNTTTLANSMIPHITSIDTVTATMGSTFNYAVIAGNNPTSYSAANLPPGLTINTTTGVISGVPAVAPSTGVSAIVATIYASNLNGTGSKAILISIIPIALPYGGTAALIPGKIEAENYDYGGEGVAYHDTDPANTLGQYRTSEGVDIENCTDTGGGYSIGQIQAGEWVQYTVNVISAGTYILQLRVASVNSGEHFNVQLDGTDISGSLTVPNTSGWQTWQTITVTTPVLTAGQKQLRIQMGTGGFNINYINFIFTGVVLPVKLTAFTASARDCNTAVLKWNAANESDGSYYEVQTSTDGNYFTKAADIANIKTSAAFGYTYTYNAMNGVNYFFRLKMINKDGSFSYSQIIAITNNCINKIQATIAPNPVSSVLKINNLDGRINFIIVYNTNGREVIRTSSTDNTALIDMSAFASGNYLVKIINEEGNVVKVAMLAH